jgi:hypothetical protein
MVVALARVQQLAQSVGVVGLRHELKQFDQRLFRQEEQGEGARI